MTKSDKVQALLLRCLGGGLLLIGAETVELCLDSCGVLAFALLPIPACDPAGHRLHFDFLAIRQES